MSNIILLILCFVAGMLMQRAKLMAENAATLLNSFIIHIPVPALALLYIHELKFSSGIVLVVVMAWLHFILAAGFFWLVDQYLKSSRARVGALILTGGMGNTAFRIADDRGVLRTKRHCNEYLD